MMPMYARYAPGTAYPERHGTSGRNAMKQRASKAWRTDLENRIPSIGKLPPAFSNTSSSIGLKSWDPEGYGIG